MAQYSSPLMAQPQNASTMPQTPEEQLQALLNGGLVPSGPTPAAPVAPAPVSKVAKAVKRLQKSAPSAPAQPQAPLDPTDPRTASPGTFHDPYADKLTEDQQREIALKNRVLYQSPEELAARYSGIEQIPAIKELAQGNRDYKDIIAMEAAKGQQPDLSGLMTLGDVLSNGKYDLRGGYKAPGDKAKELLGNMDKAQDNQKDLMKDVIALANSGKAGLDVNTINSLLLSKIGEGFKTTPPPRPSNYGVDNYHKWVTNTDKQFQDFDKQTQQINQLRQEVAAGNPIDDARIGILRASMDAHGRPNIAEVNREAGNQAAGARLMNSWEMLSKGNISDENRALYTQSFNNILQYLDGERKKTADRMRQQGKVGYGLSDTQINARLPKDYVDKASGGGQAAAAPVPQTAREKEMQSIQDSNKQLLQHLEDLKKARGGN